MHNTIKKQSIVDMSYLEEYAEGDDEVIKELLGTFFEGSFRELKNLHSNITEGENEEWTSTAHKLKGLASYVGAHSLKELCDVAQNMNPASLNDRQKIYNEIENDYDRVCRFLREKIL